MRILVICIRFSSSKKSSGFGTTRSKPKKRALRICVSENGTMKIGKLYRVRYPRGAVVGLPLKTLPTSGRYDFSVSMGDYIGCHRFGEGEIVMRVGTVEVPGNQPDPVYQEHAAVLYCGKLWLFDRSVEEQTEYLELVSE